MTDHRRATVLIGGGSGAIDAVDGAGLTAGDTIQCINSTGLYTYINVQDSAVEDSPAVIRPDSNPGTNSWHLQSLIPPMSHVSAYSNAGTQSIATHTPETVIYENERYDDLAEYNHVTGIFTAQYSGKYLVSANLILASSSAWTSNEVMILAIKVNGTIVFYGPQTRVEVSINTAIGAVVIGTVSVDAGETIEIEVVQYSDSSININTLAEYNFLTIDRLI